MNEPAGLPRARLGARRRDRPLADLGALADGSCSSSAGCAFFVYRARGASARSRNPVADYDGVTEPRLELARGRGRGRRGRAAARLLDPALGRPRRATSRRRRSRPWSAWSASSSPGTSTTRAPTASSARPTIDSSTSQTNPLGLDRSDPAAKDDVTTVNQLHLPVEQAGDRPPLEQGRDPQLRPARDAGQAGRRSRASRSRSGSMPTVTTAEMRSSREARVRATRSPAPSSAASATTACAAS